MSQKFLVRHGLINYTSEDGFPRTAFRNMTVELYHQAEIDKLKQFGAIVSPDVELEKQGRMGALPETASDEEIISWVSGAQPSETRALLLERPMLAQRIRAAVEIVNDRMKHQQELLSGVMDTVEETEAEVKATVTYKENATGADPDAKHEPPAPGAVPLAKTDGTTPDENGGQGSGEPNGDQGNDSNPAPSADSAEPDQVVTGNAAQVSEYLSKHPGEAPLILEAENRRVEALRAQGKTNEQPRAGVLRAVQAAAAHTAQ